VPFLFHCRFLSVQEAPLIRGRHRLKREIETPDDPPRVEKRTPLLDNPDDWLHDHGTQATGLVRSGEEVDALIEVWESHIPTYAAHFPRELDFLCLLPDLLSESPDVVGAQPETLRRKVRLGAPPEPLEVVQALLGIT